MATNRTWHPVETRLVAEWSAVRYPDSRVLTRVRVGSVHADLRLPGLTPAEQKLAGVFRRWVDALVFLRDSILVVEAAVLADPGKVAQLDLYMRLVPNTPELARWRDMPLRGVLLCGVADPLVSMLARERGFIVESYLPPWASAYLQTLPARKRTPTLTEIPD